ncbi:Zinc finger, RING/FYVE/PHD-type [Plasmopara halstedii]|uniref:Zinc finger, RING/FYVE/PHD-type n=1 Tax=Plasmopara halstedii TaxID=4781 RepID=A0A0P1ALN7_PLAHL|nr:Zinc finger, RING/FYVE/PHD-type [Plasmopara halstedii]CEG42220.1 Zinc finger, RING/FYVE/PHD-type [Plasmopara halstedii]|eukprot:XP_024578589.1 Zinc finger, RING/FYVE/PHD-type [Plasmopara halstedii]
MVKGRFIINPFGELVLTPGDLNNLHELTSTILDSNLARYEHFLTEDKGQIDLNHWKLVKGRESIKVYQERSSNSHSHAVQTSKPSSELSSMLGVGTTVGELDDLMFGVVSPTLEMMRIRASYVEDISGAAVLANIVEPTVENPFNSMVVKWMEMDIPLQAMGLVRNRDYIYLEVTGFVHLESGDRVGYQLLHSVDFPVTHNLPNRVRANLSNCSFFRQVRPNACEVFATGIIDPGGEKVRRFVISVIANTFLSTLKYAYCGQMKKLQLTLETRYAEAKELGTPNREPVCVTCNAHITNRRLGDFGKTDASCKLCFGYVCNSCKIQRKVSFVTPDLLLALRKVTFCAVCFHEAIHASAADTARARIAANFEQMSKSHYYNHTSETSTVSEYGSSCG